jgi:hypothetical protein
VQNICNNTCRTHAKQYILHDVQQKYTKKLKKQSVESNMQTEKISCKYMEKQTHQNMQIFDPKYA